MQIRSKGRHFFALSVCICQTPTLVTGSEFIRRLDWCVQTYQIVVAILGVVAIGRTPRTVIGVVSVQLVFIIQAGMIQILLFVADEVLSDLTRNVVQVQAQLVDSIQALHSLLLFFECQKRRFIQIILLQ
jgi:hypothetical protein